MDIRCDSYDIAYLYLPGGYHKAAHILPIYVSHDNGYPFLSVCHITTTYGLIFEFDFESLMQSFVGFFDVIVNRILHCQASIKARLLRDVSLMREANTS